MNSKEDRRGAAEQEDRMRSERVLANSGATGENFGEPRGWALKWDGTGLPEDTEVTDGGAMSEAQDSH
jgi:hypothetical protein